jgi:rubrerythrin
MCANPRKTFKELTIQEKRHFQELEVARLRHSNGTVVDEIEVYLEVRNGNPPTY